MSVAPKAANMLSGYLATLPGPARRSITQRMDDTSNAKRKISRYRDLMDPRYRSDEPEPRAQRILALLWAKAFIERALAAETNGLLGDEAATPGRLARSVIHEQVGRVR